MAVWSCYLKWNAKHDLARSCANNNNFELCHIYTSKCLMRKAVINVADSHSHSHSHPEQCCYSYSWCLSRKKHIIVFCTWLWLCHLFSLFKSELQNVIAPSILHGFPWKLNCELLHMLSRCLYYKTIILFQFHVFASQRAISRVRQLYQLEYTTEWSKTLFSLAVICYLGAQNFLRNWDDNLIYGSCCVENNIGLGLVQCNSYHKSDCHLSCTENFEHLNNIQ